MGLMATGNQAPTDKYFSLFNSLDEGAHISELIYNELGVPVDWRYLEVNKSFVRHTGLVNAPGRLGSEIAPGTEPYWFEAFDKVIRTGETLRFENYNEFTKRWYSAYTIRVGETGSKRFAVVFYDITDRKMHERQQDYWVKLNDALRSIGNSIEIEDTVTHMAMDFFKADRCFYCRIEGEKGIITRDAAREDLPSVAGIYPLSSFAIFEKVVMEGRPFLAHDTRTSEILDETLRELCIQMHIISFVDVPVTKNGEAVGILCLAQSEPRQWTGAEVSLAVETAERTWAAVERARAEEALRQREQQLRQLLTLRDEFIGIASHELNTPVTSIRAYAQIIQARLDELGLTGESHLHQRLNLQIGRLSALIRDLLDTSKMSEGKMKFHFEQSDMNGLIRQRLEEIASTTTTGFDTHMQDLPPILADRERIGQVITNLLTNAIKYSPRNTIVTIRTERTDDHVAVSVQDEGYGIAPEDQQKIFDRFYRVFRQDMENLPGMGLGLYISAQIIKHHHGTLTVKSQLGKGSTFSFTIPLAHRP